MTQSVLRQRDLRRKVNYNSNIHRMDTLKKKKLQKQSKEEKNRRDTEKTEV